MTGLIIFAIFGMASAGHLGDHHHHPHAHDPVGPHGSIGPVKPIGPVEPIGPVRPVGPDIPRPFLGTGGDQVTRTIPVSGIMTFDRHACIFRNGEIQLRGPVLDIGEAGVLQILSGFATLESGHRVSVEGGLVHVRILHPENAAAITSALSRTVITLEQFLQQTGTIPPQQGVIEVTSGVLSISGTYRNVNSGVMVQVGLGVVPTEPITPGTVTDPIITHSVNGIITFDRHACIFRKGEITLQGTPIGIGEAGAFKVLSAFANLESGHRVHIEGGFVHTQVLHPRNTAAIRSALSRAGMTIEQFLQQIGTIPPQLGVIEVTAGVLSISGTYRNINSGVMVVVLSDVEVPTEPATGHSAVVTETVAPETVTVSQPVTLTKTSTRDEYITITSPVYYSVHATFTNFVRQTVTVHEEQVIRSPVAGRIVVNTIPVSTQTILTMTDTATNYFIKTDLVTLTSTLQHLASNFAFRTITVNNIITSTVVHTITRTSIATV